MNKNRSILALGAFFVAVALAVSACGGSSTGDSVAVVAGNPISTKAFKHWMFVAAKGQAAQSPGQPIIVPSDPPQFKGCVAQVRAKIPTLAKTSDKQLAADCKQLFTSLSSQVMDFLIKAYWYQADAHRLHVTVTNAQIQNALAAAKKAQFPTATQFQAFLTSSGLTLDDVLFRVRVSQIFNKLLAKHPTTVSNAQILAYYQSHASQFGTPESRNIRIVAGEDAGSGPGRAVRSPARLELGHGGQEVLDRPDDQEDRWVAQRCGPRASRTRRSTAPPSPPSRTSSAARSRASSATTCTR